MRRTVANKKLFCKQVRNVKTRTASSGGVRNLYQAILANKGQGSYCVVRKVGGIGDVLMILPSLRQIKSEFPHIRLTFALDRHRTANDNYYSLCANLPFIDNIVDARYVNHSNYKYVADVSAVCIRYERSDLPAVNRIDLFAQHLGVQKIANKIPQYIVEGTEAHWASEALMPLRAAEVRLVALHTASMDGKRCWPKERYLELVEACAGLPIHFVVFDYNNVFNNWDKFDNVTNFSNTNIREMAALIGQCDLFVGPDSGPMHIAAAVRTPAIVLFGSIPPEARINYYPTHVAITSDSVSCLGCWYSPCRIQLKCMKDITAIHVRLKIQEYL